MTDVTTTQSFFHPQSTPRYKSTYPHKAPGYDLIDCTILKTLPRKAIVLLTSFFNSMLRPCYFTVQWKYAQIIMIAKPGKPPTEASSYRPISLLPIMFKVFERLLLHRLDETIHIDGLLPIHQFGFRNNHSTIHNAIELSTKSKRASKERKCVPQYSSTYNKLSTKYGTEDYYIN